MTRAKWKLTREAEVDEWGDGEGRRFGRPVVGLVERMAEDPDNGLDRLAPGVYRGAKAP